MKILRFKTLICIQHHKMREIKQILKEDKWIECKLKEINKNKKKERKRNRERESFRKERIKLEGK